MKVYIAGQITGNAGYRQQFMAAELQLAEMGHSVMNPAWICPYAEFEYADYIAVSKAMLARCEGILLLPHWEASRGAKDELKWAEAHGLKVFDASKDKTGVNGGWEELSRIALAAGLCGGSMEEAAPLQEAYKKGYNAGRADAARATRKKREGAK